MWSTFYDGCTHFFRLQNLDHNSRYKARKSQDIFKYNWLHPSERRKSYAPRMAWGWVNHGVNFIFGWTVLQYIIDYVYVDTRQEACKLFERQLHVHKLWMWVHRNHLCNYKFHQLSQTSFIRNACRNFLHYNRGTYRKKYAISAIPCQNSWVKKMSLTSLFFFFLLNYFELQRPITCKINNITVCINNRKH